MEQRSSSGLTLNKEQRRISLTADRLVSPFSMRQYAFAVLSSRYFATSMSLSFRSFLFRRKNFKFRSTSITSILSYYPFFQPNSRILQDLSLFERHVRFVFYLKSSSPSIWFRTTMLISNNSLSKNRAPPYPSPASPAGHLH